MDDHEGSERARYYRNRERRLRCRTPSPCQSRGCSPPASPERRRGTWNTTLRGVNHLMPDARRLFTERLLCGCVEAEGVPGTEIHELTNVICAVHPDPVGPKRALGDAMISDRSLGEFPREDREDVGVRFGAAPGWPGPQHQRLA